MAAIAAGNSCSEEGVLVMGTQFDPYREWLGVQVATRPLNHYQLLGISLGETDPEQIEDAAETRLATLREHVAGEHGKLARRTQFEIESAKQCLLDPATRLPYDEGLKQQGLKFPAPPPPSDDDELSLLPIETKRARPTEAQPASPSVAQPARQMASASPVKVSQSAPRNQAPRNQAPALRPVNELDALSSLPEVSSVVSNVAVVKSRRREQEEAKARQKQYLMLGSAGGGLLVLCIGLFVGIRSFRQTAEVVPVTVEETATPEVPVTVPPAGNWVPPSTVVPPVTSKTPAPKVAPKTQEPPTTQPVPAPLPGRTPEPPPEAPRAFPQPLPTPAPNDFAGFNGNPANKRPANINRLPVPPAPLPAEKGPFALFPRNIELPPLVGGSGKPVPLGKIDLEPEMELTLELLDGVDGNKPTVLFRMETELTNAPPQWTIVASAVRKSTPSATDETPASFRVARFTLVAEGMLEFAWLDEAVSIAASSLRNCVVNLGAHEKGQKKAVATRSLALRCAQVSALTRLDPTKDEVTIPLRGESLPDRSSFRLQLVELKGFPDWTVVVPDKFTAGHRDQIRIIADTATSKTPGIEIRFWIEALASGSVLKIGAVAVDDKGETLPFSQERVMQLSRTVPRELQEGQQDLLNLQAEYRGIELTIRNLVLAYAADINERQKINFNIQTARKRLGKVGDNIIAKQKRVVYMSWLNSIIPGLINASQTLQNNAQFDFRVFYVVDDREVDVLTTR